MQAFSQNSFAEVDDHDIGQGWFNIFIYPTGTWGPLLERVYAFLKLRGVLKEALVVKRLKTSEKYVVVWPERFKGMFELQNPAKTGRSQSFSIFPFGHVHNCWTGWKASFLAGALRAPQPYFYWSVD